MMRYILRVKLVSDFIDYYDCYMDVTNYDTVFYRRTTQGPNRVDMLSMLQAIGLEVPAHGIISDIYNGMVSGLTGLTQEKRDEYLQKLQFVVYTDQHAHCGEGKVKVSLKEAHEKYPNLFATTYIHNRQGLGESLRLLSIGNEKIWLHYTSKDDWRSNAGDCEISIFDNPPDLKLNHIKVPLYAIDFIPTLGSHSLLAVDFNIAPGLRGTPVTDLYKPQEVADLIKDKIQQLRDCDHADCRR